MASWWSPPVGTRPRGSGTSPPGSPSRCCRATRCGYTTPPSVQMASWWSPPVGTRPRGSGTSPPGSPPGVAGPPGLGIPRRLQSGWQAGGHRQWGQDRAALGVSCMCPWCGSDCRHQAAGEAAAQSAGTPRLRHPRCYRITRAVIPWRARRHHVCCQVRIDWMEICLGLPASTPRPQSRQSPGAQEPG